MSWVYFRLLQCCRCLEYNLLSGSVWSCLQECTSQRSSAVYSAKSELICRKFCDFRRRLGNGVGLWLARCWVGCVAHLSRRRGDSLSPTRRCVDCVGEFPANSGLVLIRPLCGMCRATVALLTTELKIVQYFLLV